MIQRTDGGIRGFCSAIGLGSSCRTAASVSAMVSRRKACFPVAIS